jgi:hypothetical protein
VSRSDDYRTAHPSAGLVVVLDHGYQAAFLALVVLAGIGVTLALLLLGPPRTARQHHIDQSPATNAGD